MADDYRIEIEGFDSLRQRLTPEKMRRGLRTGMQIVTFQLKSDLIENLRGRILKRQNGNLSGGVTSEVVEEDGSIIGQIGNTVRWRWKGRSGSLLEVHEKGATIRPREPGGYLRFKIGQNWITTKQVVIPAREPVKKTVQAKLIAIKNNLRTALLRELRGE